MEVEGRWKVRFPDFVMMEADWMGIDLSDGGKETKGETFKYNR